MLIAELYAPFHPRGKPRGNLAHLLYLLEFHNKLPRDSKEFALFVLIISLISVNILAPLITCLEVGFSGEVWASCLTILPFIWLCVVALVYLSRKPAGKLAGRLTERGDSFKACILADILCSVLIMSIFLTVIGTWIGTRSLTMDPIRNFFHMWPRNFAVAFAVEALVAQPIARYVMQRVHAANDGQEQAA